MFVGNKDWYGPDGEWYLTSTDGLHFALSGPGFIHTAPAVATVPLCRTRPIRPITCSTTPSTHPPARHRFDDVPPAAERGVGPFANDAWTPHNCLAAASPTAARCFTERSSHRRSNAARLDYVVAFSTPSYNTYATTYPPDPNIYNGGDNSVSNALRGSSSTIPNYQPGWLAIHDAASGKVRGLRLLNVTEA